MVDWLGGQWQQMFLTQPPVRRVRVIGYGHWSGASEMVEDPVGVRIGAVMEIIFRWLKTKR